MKGRERNEIRRSREKNSRWVKNKTIMKFYPKLKI